MPFVRRASHAGTDGAAGWYPSDKTQLHQLFAAFGSSASILDVFLDRWKTVSATSRSEGRRLVGVIGPHAGIRFSGPTSHVAYRHLAEYLATKQGAGVRRVVMLGPSHKKYFEGVEMSQACAYETTIGHPLRVDNHALEQIRKRCTDVGVPNAWMSQQTDEDEHSIEMHVPFVAEAIAASTPAGSPPRDIAIAPIVVGDVSDEWMQRLAQVVAPLMASEENLFVFSTDFCHWGSRFRYQHHFQKERLPSIEQAVVAMDREGMRLLEQRDDAGWQAYLLQTKNTICGRNPLSVMLKAMDLLEGTATVGSGASTKRIYDICFMHYAKSGPLRTSEDSSVSYASALIVGE